jgi:hypothetical protein
MSLSREERFRDAHIKCRFPPPSIAKFCPTSAKTVELPLSRVVSRGRAARLLIRWLGFETSGRHMISKP